MTENLNRAERRRSKRDKGKMTKGASRKKSGSLNFVLTLVLVLGFLALTYWLLSSPPEPENNQTNEVKVGIMGRDHAASTDGFEYNSNPPTSGLHYPDWHRDWKFYDSELPTGGLIHNMEHGGVVVFYQPELDQESKELLEDFVNGEDKMIAASNADIPVPIAMAAWGVYEYFDVFDKVGMKAFYKRNRNKGPENVYP